MELKGAITVLPTQQNNHTGTIEADNGLRLPFSRHMFKGDPGPLHPNQGVVVEVKIVTSGRDSRPVIEGIRIEDDRPVAPTGEFVQLISPRSNLSAEVKMGFSWTVLIFGFFFGIPLFMRRLVMPGLVMAGLMVIYYFFLFNARYLEFGGQRIYFLFGARVTGDEMSMYMGGFWLIYLVISIYFASGANKWYARNLVEDGYELAPKHTEEQRAAFAQFAGLATPAPGQRPAAAMPAPLAPAAASAADRPIQEAMVQHAAQHRAPHGGVDKTEEAATDGPLEKLRALKQMLAEGLISEEEFSAKRSSLLDGI